MLYSTEKIDKINTNTLHKKGDVDDHAETINDTDGDKIADEVSCSTPLKQVDKSNCNNKFKSSQLFKVVDYSLTDVSTFCEDDSIEENNNSSYSEEYFLNTPAAPLKNLFFQKQNKPTMFQGIPHHTIRNNLNESSSSEYSCIKTPAKPLRSRTLRLTTFVPDTPENIYVEENAMLRKMQIN